MCMAGAASLGGMIAGASGQVMAAGGAVMQGRSTMAAAEYEEDVAKNNALLAKYQAEDASRRGEIQVDDINQAISQLTGQGRATMGAGNILLGSGSALSWEQDVAATGARDIAMSEYNTSMERWGFDLQRDNFLAAGESAIWAGRQRLYAGYIQALSQSASQGGSLLSMMGPTM